MVAIPDDDGPRQWTVTRRDPRADYRAFWNADPPRILAIGFMQDTDQTRVAAMADVATLTLGSTEHAP